MQKTKTYIPTAFSASSNGEAGCLSALENNLKENIGITNLKLYLEMKNAKLKFALMAMLLCLCTTGWADDDSHDCGVSNIDGLFEYTENDPARSSVEWSYEDGVLTFTGTGYMANFENAGEIPWESFKSDIETIVIEDGVKSVGDKAFSYCTSLTSVSLSNTVERIGENAFDCCTSLTSIDVPGSVEVIANEAFYNCESLSDVTFHEGLKEIGDAAFTSTEDEEMYCHFTNLFFPEGLESIGSGCFANNQEVIKNVIIPSSVTQIGGGCFEGDRISYFAYLPSGSNALIDIVEDYTIYGKICMASDIEDNDEGSLNDFLDNNRTSNNFINGWTITPDYSQYDYRAGTICFPFDSKIDFYKENGNYDLSFFTVAGKSGNSIALERFSGVEYNQDTGKLYYKLDKGVPYIYKTSRESLNFSFIWEGITAPHNMNGFVGNIYYNNPNRNGDILIPYEDGKELYVVSGNKFIRIGSGQQGRVAQFKAYLDLSDGVPNMTKAEAKARNLVLWGEDGTFDEDETSVDGICTAGAIYAVGTYSVDGVKRAAKQKGLNIVKMSDGSVKKVMVK